MRARKLSIVIASYWQTLSHLLQEIHPTLHTFFVSAPLSSERQKICTSLFSGTSSRRFFEHVGIHNPQPVHLSSITTGSPFLLMYMASKGHAFTQLARPRQPYTQLFDPPDIRTAALQSCIP